MICRLEPVEDFTIFGTYMRQQYLSRNRQIRYVMVYWDADNVHLPPADKLDTLFHNMKEMILAKLGVSAEEVDYVTTLVCNSVTKNGIKDQQIYKLDNRGITLQVVSPIKEAADRAVELNIKHNVEVRPLPLSDSHVGSLNHLQGTADVGFPDYQCF